jgi:hypothetical protein
LRDRKWTASPSKCGYEREPGAVEDTRTRLTGEESRLHTVLWRKMLAFATLERHPSTETL